jgi:hypothetical protein
MTKEKKLQIEKQRVEQFVKKPLHPAKINSSSQHISRVLYLFLRKVTIIRLGLKSL